MIRYLIVALLVTVSVTEPLRAKGDPISLGQMIQRGATKRVITLHRKETGTKYAVWRYEDFMFDGERWLSLDTPEGMVLFIDVQHEENPDMME